jgi:hypothetical protein
MECGEKCSRGCDPDSQSSRAGNYRKQATTKKGLFDDRSEQPVDKNQVPQVNHVSGWSRGMSNDVDPNSKPDPAQQGGNKMNSTRPNPSKKGPDLVSMSKPYDRVQRADERQGNCELERKSRIVESGLTEYMKMNSNAEHHG